MTLSPDGMLSHYRIVEKIGEGGMGVVWKAYDTTLRRNVAIKVLPARVVENEERRQRFVREARTAAAVNHPNLTTVHEIGESDGITFIVMEYVEGDTLRARIRGKPLPLSETLRIAVQVADGLSHAHRARVVHRDLKPENVMIGADGHVRVLDFGLAKLLEEQQREISTSQMAQATTISDELTREGKVFGTAAYMSPEQARGMRLDARSDIFSYGVTLYEMATGLQPFRGPTPMDTLTAILNSEPVPASRLSDEVPIELERIIGKCLRKDAEDRYQDTRDLLVDLRHLKRETDSVPVQRAGAGPRQPRGWRRYRSLIAGIGAVLLLVVIGWYLAPRLFEPRALRRTGRPPVQTRLTTNPLERPVRNASISPDGHYLAFSDPDGVYMRVIDTGEVKRLAVPEGTTLARNAWFPDGSRLLVETYDEEKDLRSIEIYSNLTGRLQTVRDNAQAFSISPDGKRIAMVPGERELNEIWVMDVGGGNEHLIAAPAERENLMWWVLWSPDSQRIAYRRQTRTVDLIVHNAIETRDLQGGSPTVVLPPLRHIFPGIHGAWIPDGRIIFTKTESAHRPQDVSFWEIPVDTASGRPLGEPQHITDLSGSHIYRLSVTDDGKRLAFIKWLNQLDILTVSLNEEGQGIGPPRKLTTDEAFDAGGKWTHDGRHVLFTSDRRGTKDLFRVDIESGEIEAIAPGPDDETDPQLSPDGEWLLYRSQPRRDESNINYATITTVMRLAYPDGSRERIQEIAHDDFLACGTRAGSRCVLGEMLEKEIVFFQFDPISGKGAELARTDFEPSAIPWLVLSPDATRVAMVNYSGSDEQANRVRVVDLDTGKQSEFSIDGRDHVPALGWTADGKGFYATYDDPAVLYRIDLEGRSRKIMEFPNLDVGTMSASPDGRHLVFTSLSRKSTVWMMERF